MPVIDRLLKRLGYAKLDIYGLILTPDDRIMSTRAAILDDGLGGRIVGWTDADLATMELEKWAPRAIATPVTKVAALPPIPSNHEAVRPAPTQAVATRVASAPAPMRHAFVAVIPPIPAASFAKAAPAPIAVERELTEDEWEWEIAAARARAAADETALVAIPTPRPVAAPQRPVAAPQPVSAPRRTRLETLPPPLAATPSTKFVSSHPRTLPGVAPIASPKVAPIAVLAAAPITANATFPTAPATRDSWVAAEARMAELVPATRDSWVAAEARMAELETTRVDVVVAPAPTPAPIPAIRALPRASSPHTVIPVPKLPTLAKARMIDPNSNWIEPVVRRTMPTPIPPREPRRFAKGTGPIVPETTSAKIPDANLTTQPFSVDDRTLTNLVIPPLAATAIPSIKRQATRG